MYSKDMDSEKYYFYKSNLQSSNYSDDCFDKLF